MFELSDDDDNFWESLPMEDITNISEPVPTKQVDITSHVVDNPAKKFKPNSDVGNVERTHQNPNHVNTTHKNISNRKPIDSDNSCTRFDLNRNYEVANFDDNKRTGVSVIREVEKRQVRDPPSSRRPLTCESDLIQTRNCDSVVLSSSAKSSNKLNLGSNGGPMFRTNTSSVMGGNKLETPKRAKRKFPGPAGLLPKLSPGQRLDGVSVPGLSPRVHAESRDDTVILYSQSGDDMFSDSPWCSLLDDLQEHKKEVLTSYSVSTNLYKASKKLLPDGKVSLMLAVVETVDIQGPDACVTLKDKTGKVLGTMHRDVVKEFASELHPGVALVLKQVSVVSPSSRSHYLNITHNNIVHLYGHKAVRTPEEVAKLRRTLHCVVQAANSQPSSVLPHTPSPFRRSPPEFNRNLEGETTLRQPQVTTPVRHPSFGQHNATSKSLPSTHFPSINRHHQIQGDNHANAQSTSLSETPSKKFSFRPVNKSGTNSPHLGASPVLPRTGSVSKVTAGRAPEVSATVSVSRTAQQPMPVVARQVGGTVDKSSVGLVTKKISRTSEQPVVSGSNMATNDSFSDADLWQDELGDELISQLSEEMM